MSNSTISPNMNLIVPTVGQEPGPTWANDLNASLGILDQHNHGPGQGVQITPVGLNINADLSLNQNNLTNVNTVNFKNLPSTLAGSAPNLGCAYVAGGELVYNDEAGNVVAITKTGSVNAGAGSITGLPSGTASASYSGGTFVWQSATNTPANLDAGSIVLRNIAANSKGLTLNPPNSMAVDYSITFPFTSTGPPSVLTIDSTGQISGASGTIDSTSADSIANSRQRPTGQIVAVGGVAKSFSSGSFSTSSSSSVPVTNLSVIITTSGRPVWVGLMSDGAGSLSYIGVSAASGPFLNASFDIIRGVSVIGLYVMSNQGPNPSFITVPSSSLSCVDFVLAGTYTYTCQVSLVNGSSVGVVNSILVAYEL